LKETKCDYIPLSSNLIDEIWKRKKRELKRKFYILPENSVGENYKSKINKISSTIKKNNADFQFITASENNAWLLNIRGKDSLYSPVPNSYILIDQNKNVNFFCDLKKITSSFKKKFNRVKFIDINNVEEILLKIKKKEIYN
jgi:Xaa-Pro aminopeptidase